MKASDMLPSPPLRRTQRALTKIEVAMQQLGRNASYLFASSRDIASSSGAPLLS
jgi:hypothetical protein